MERFSIQVSFSAYSVTPVVYHLQFTLFVQFQENFEAILES